MDEARCFLNFIACAVKDERITFDTLANILLEMFCTKNKVPFLMLAITGPSCVGKTTLAETIVSTLKNNEKSVAKISVDNYLLDEHKGDEKYRRFEYVELSPSFFDWGALSMDINALRIRSKIIVDNYVRGVGWGNREIINIPQILILEGLFLDSVEAIDHINPVATIVLETSKKNIANWRVKRDKYFRENFTNFSRSKYQTIKEIKRILEAYSSYTRGVPVGEYIKLRINDRFEVVSLQNAKIDM